MDGLEAITFDAGGTLIEPWPSVGHVYAEVAARFGCVIAPEILNERFALAWRAKQRFDYSLFAWSALVNQTFAGLLDGVPGPALFDALYRRFEQPDAWRVFEEARPTLESLRRRGLKLGIISNWDIRLRPLLERLKLAGFFDAIAVSAEVGSAKPSATIFQHTAQALSVPPSAMLHVGDSLEEDVRGARAAGLRAVWLRRSRRAPLADAIASLAALCD